MNTYKKLAEMRDETIFLLKSKKRELTKLLNSGSEMQDRTILYTLAQFEELFKLYEIE